MSSTGPLTIAAWNVDYEAEACRASECHGIVHSGRPQVKSMVCAVLLTTVDPVIGCDCLVAGFVLSSARKCSLHGYAMYLRG